MNENIPVTFDDNGKKSKGHFEAPFGLGGNTWHLMVNSYYWESRLTVSLLTCENLPGTNQGGRSSQTTSLM